MFAETTERAGIRRLRPLLKFQLDRGAKFIDASLAAGFSSRAVFHDGLGCVLLHGAKEPYLLKNDIDALKDAENAAAVA